MTVFAAPAAAAPGELDPEFGDGGRVVTDYAGDFEEGWGVAIQGDGRIVIAGEAVLPDTGRDFAVVRYRETGALDSSFGDGGKVSTHLGRNFEVAFAMALQPDGKIIAAGTSGQAENINDPFVFDFALARYATDGSLDRSFGGDGMVLTDFFGDSDQVFGVALQPDGRVVVAGFARPTGDFALARYRTDGTLDPTFGAGGKVVTDFAGTDGRARAVAVQYDGKILAAGSRTDPVTGNDFALMRYRPDGSPDPTFGTGGLVTTDFAGGDDEANGMTLAADGTILLTGVRDQTASSGEFALTRYRPDGTLDQAFGTGGKVATNFTPGPDVAFGVTIQPDRRIVAVGGADFVLPVSGDFAAARYLPNGRLDGTFGAGGTVVTDFAGGLDNAFDVTLQADGQIVAVGEVTNPATSRDIGLVRYLG